MSDNLNGRCSVFVAFGGGREGLFFFCLHTLYSFVLPSLFVCILFIWLFVLIFSDFMVYGLPKQVTGPRWTELRGRSCDGNCKENVTLKYNLRCILYYFMLVTLYKIGKVHFCLLGTNGYHLKAKNERFTAVSSLCRQNVNRLLKKLRRLLQRKQHVKI